jgi:hypothetical protein
VSAEGYVLSTGLATDLPEDLVREVASILEWYGCDQGQLTMDAAARAILQSRAWELRRAADEAAHARRRDDPLRLHESQVIADLAEARRRAREYVSADADPVRAGRAMQAQGTRHS